MRTHVRTGTYVRTYGHTYSGRLPPRFFVRVDCSSMLLAVRTLGVLGVYYVGRCVGVGFVLLESMAMPA